MSVFLQKNLVILFLFIFTYYVYSEKRTTPLNDFKRVVALKDSGNIFQEMLKDKSDDLMENHPAEDIYNNIWTSERLNPYKMPIDSLSDSVRINLSNFHIPVKGAITSEFGPRRYRFHFGIDLRLNIGDSVLAAFSGKIRIIDYESHGYGHYVVIRHNNGLETVYGHLSQVIVELNQTVKAGQLIALGGNTGHSTGPHLHFETRYIGNAINPASLINFDNGKIITENYLLTKKKTFNYRNEVKTLKLAKYHTVRKGENLGNIAFRNGTSIKSICKLNGIKQKTIIRPGQRLRVR